MLSPYKKNGENVIETVRFEIEGMTCNHCATHIEKLVKDTDGVIRVQISYPDGSGEITFDQSKISVEELAEIIDGTGSYKVVSEIPQTTIREKSGDARYDLIIIGGGSAAFSAAIKANEFNLKTLMVNDGLPFGGTCVNVGCLPSKALIRAAETAYHASYSGFAGVRPKGADIDFKRIFHDIRQLVRDMQQKKYLDVVADFPNLTLIKGRAKFIDETTISIDDRGQHTAEKFIIATGSSTNIPRIEGLDKVGYFTNKNIFELEEKPGSLTIMGAGYVGCELAMAFNRLGVKVRIIEFTDRVLRSQTRDISLELEKYIKSEGIELLPGFRAKKIEKDGSTILIHGTDDKRPFKTLHENGLILMATGTKANTAGLGLEYTGVQTDEHGHIIVNDQMATTAPHIFAAGDVCNTPPYVYTAAYEGKNAVENAFKSMGKKIDYSSLPWVVFTDPQVAGAGMDEGEAEARGIPFETSVIKLKDVPRAIAANDTRGFIKLIRNPASDKLLGIRVVAPEGGELVRQASMAIKYGITVSDLAEDLYPYLTLSEGIKLAAITFGKDVSRLSCCAS